MFSAIHLGEGLQGEFPEELVLDVGEQAVGLQVADGGDGDAPYAEGPRQAPTEVYAGQDVLAFRIHVPNRATEPALVANVIGQRSVPDVHGAEVGPVGVGVADALNDGELALVPEALEGLHAGPQPDVVVDLDDVVLGYAHGRAIVVVVAAGVRDDRVEGIVATRELNYHELAVPVASVTRSHCDLLGVPRRGLRVVLQRIVISKFTGARHWRQGNRRGMGHMPGRGGTIGVAGDDLQVSQMACLS